MNEILKIGQIVNVHGLKGFVKVNPFTDDINRFEELEYVLLEVNKKLVTYEIEKVAYVKKAVLIKFKNIDSVENAEKLRGIFLNIDRKDAKKLPEGKYFIVDLLDSKVYTTSKEYLGKLIDIFNTGSNDIYVVKGEDGKEILLPSIPDVVKNIDVKNKEITVELIEGLI